MVHFVWSIELTFSLHYLISMNPCVSSCCFAPAAWAKSPLSTLCTCAPTCSSTKLDRLYETLFYGEYTKGCKLTAQTWRFLSVPTHHPSPLSYALCTWQWERSLFICLWSCFYGTSFHDSFDIEWNLFVRKNETRKRELKFELFFFDWKCLYSIQVEPESDFCLSNNRRLLCECVYFSILTWKSTFCWHEHVHAGVKCVLNSLFDAGISSISIVEIMEGHQEDDGWQVKKKKQRPAPAPVVEDHKSKPSLFLAC